MFCGEHIESVYGRTWRCSLDYKKKIDEVPEMYN
jgi:hypothetical protein